MSSTPSEQGLAERTAALAEPRAFFARLGALKGGLVAFGLGAGGALAHAPLFFWPALLVALTGLVWLIDGAVARTRAYHHAHTSSVPPRAVVIRAAAWRGWCFASGYFLAGTWWVANAFIARGPEFAPFAVLGALGLACGLALFWAAACAVAALFWRDNFRRIFVFALAITVAESLRATMFSGFPWNLAGYVWPAGGAISQSAAVLGASGLSALTIFAFAAPAALGGPDPSAHKRAVLPAIGFAIFAALYASGLGRLAGAEVEMVEDVQLRIIQADVKQNEKWQVENRDAIREHYLRLVQRPGLDTRTHVIWPESALPLFLLEEPRVLDRIAAVIGAERVLLTGLIRRDFSEPLEPAFYNTFAAISFARGVPVVEAVYDKNKLVPFGEFIPLTGLARRLGLRSLTNAAASYTPGPGPATIPIPGAPNVAPQICYEAIFPGFTPRGAERPAWIVNVSNDAWYGATMGPLQGYNQARYRAIEEGVPVVRAATGGVSGVIDPFGRATAEAPIMVDFVVDAPLPAPAPATLYALVGEVGLIVLLVLGLGLAVSGPRAQP